MTCEHPLHHSDRRRDALLRRPASPRRTADRHCWHRDFYGLRQITEARVRQARTVEGNTITESTLRAIHPRVAHAGNNRVSALSRA
jgi:hypothetical protein